MKKLILILVLLVGCKKEDKTEQVTITVLESGTTMPISGAEISLTGSNYPGTTFPAIFFTGVTDEYGTVHMDTKKFKSGSFFEIKKDKYWETFTRIKKTTLYITPEGWLKLRLHPVRAYGTDVSLQLEIRKQDNSQSNGAIDGSFPADTDGTVLLRGFGGVPNKIVWQVYGVSPDLDTNSTLNNLQVPRLDTLRNITLEY